MLENGKIVAIVDFPDVCETFAFPYVSNGLRSLCDIVMPYLSRGQSTSSRSRTPKHAPKDRRETLSSFEDEKSSRRFCFHSKEQMIA